MAHDVFICYSAKDRTTANTVCAVLESEGIGCWMAPRDISPGSDYGESIIDGINQAKVLVLVFSANANASQSQIKREVERAVSKDIPVIPFRIEDVLPTRALEYFLSTPHWLDAFAPPLEAHIHSLANAVRRQLGRPAAEYASPLVSRTTRVAVSGQPNMSTVAPIAAAALAGARQVVASAGRFVTTASAASAAAATAVAAAVAAKGRDLLAELPRLKLLAAHWWADRTKRMVVLGAAGLCLVALMAGMWLLLKGSASPEDRNAWDVASAADSLPSFAWYLKAYPDGYYAGDARERVSDIRTRLITAWIRTRETGTSGAYREFIAEWGKHGMFVGEAGAAIARNEEMEQQERQRWANVPGRLAAAGLYSGPIDGMKSPSTIAAVVALQHASNLPRTGIVDDATSGALDAAVVRNKASHDAYDKAVSLHTRAAYEAFLASNPASSDAADVRRRMAACHMETKTQAVATAQFLPKSGSGQGGNALMACAYAREEANSEGSSECVASGGRARGLRIVSETPTQDVAGSVATGLLNRLFASTPRARYSCVASIYVECVHAADASRSVEVCP